MKKINVLGSCVSRVPLLDGAICEHGIADDGMEIEYFFDKQNIVCAMLPPPYEREVVDKITDENMNEKYALRSLKQNLNKDTLQMLLNSNADYVITDFMDMHMAHAKYNGTVFATQALEFYRTELGKNLWDVEKIRFLERPFEEWLPYVDEFWGKMVSKFGSDRIILNRFRCNKWYISNVGRVELIPERFHGVSHPLPELNEQARLLEDYIIKKYNPYVIDLSKYFINDENKWDNLQGAHFEQKFYREVFDAVKSIVLDGNKNRYIDDPHFFDSNRRRVEEDISLPLDVENAIDMMEFFYCEKDPLWMNMLDKLYIRGIDNVYVKKYMNLLDKV